MLGTTVMGLLLFCKFRKGWPGILRWIRCSTGDVHLGVGEALEDMLVG
jgi:hypothetical protein